MPILQMRRNEAQRNDVTCFRSNSYEELVLNNYNLHIFKLATL